MKIIDLLEATQLSPIAQAIGGKLFNTIMKDFKISNDAAVMPVPNNKVVPISQLGNKDFVYITVGPFKNNTLSAYDAVIFLKPQAWASQDILFPFVADPNNGSAVMHHLSSNGYEIGRVERIFKSGTNTWLVTWNQQDEAEKRSQRAAARSTVFTDQAIADRLAPLKLSIITQALMSIRRSHPNKLPLIAAIRSKIQHNEPTIDLEDPSGNGITMGKLNPTQLRTFKIDVLWKSWIYNTLRSNMFVNTSGHLINDPSISKVSDRNSYPEGMFAKLPQEIVKQIVKWVEATSYMPAE